MKRIDFLGANGIGKSTVYAHLRRRRRRPGASPQWLTLQEAQKKAVVKQFLDRASTADLAKAATCYLPKMGGVLAETYAIRSAENAFVERGERFQPFFEHCVEHLMGMAQPSPQNAPSGTWGGEVSAAASPGAAMETIDRHVLRAPGPMHAASPRPAQRRRATPMQFVDLSRIFGRLKELCLLESSSDTIIFDESLIHALAGLLADIPSDLMSVRTHFENVPLPEGVIHLSAPEDEVYRRNSIRRRRRGPIVRHGGLDESQLRRRTRRTLRIAEIGASTLEGRGATVLRLDATDSPKDNARRIEKWLRSGI